MINLAGKTAVVFGLANKRSIAWGIAQQLHKAGATLAICYQNERMKLEAEGLIAELPGASGFQCDVSNDAEIDSLFAALKDKYGKLDILVHAVAFAPAADLRGEFINTTREGFRTAMDVSVYSLIAVSRAAAPLMTDGGSIMTMSYYAAEKVVPNYNVMAIAKSGLECAVRYLAWNLGPKNIRVNADLRRAHQDPRRPRRRRPERDDARPRRTCPAPSQRRSARSRRRRAVPGQRPFQRHHRRSLVRRFAATT